MSRAKDYTAILPTVYDSRTMQRVTPSGTGLSAWAGAAARAGLTCLALISGFALPAGCLSSAGSAEPGHQAAPDFPTRDPQLWINSSPLSMSGLRGQVILIDVWTYG
jgi:hypothetical protein